jgi:hypothetical protein
MKRSFLLVTAASLGLLLAGSPSFGKGGRGGGGLAHSSGHAGGQHHSSGHWAPSHPAPGHTAPTHSAHPQMTHNPSTHSQAHSRPTNPQPTPGQAAPRNVAGTVNQTFTHSGGWDHGHHSGWGAWGGGVGVPWYYNPDWNGPPGVVVVPTENDIVEPEYVTLVTPPTTPTVTQPVPSLNSDRTDPEQANTVP